MYDSTSAARQVPTSLPARRRRPESSTNTGGGAGRARRTTRPGELAGGRPGPRSRVAGAGDVARGRRGAASARGDITGRVRACRRGWRRTAGAVAGRACLAGPPGVAGAPLAGGVTPDCPGGSAGRCVAPGAWSATVGPSTPGSPSVSPVASDETLSPCSPGRLGSSASPVTPSGVSWSTVSRRRSSGRSPRSLKSTGVTASIASRTALPALPGNTPAAPAPTTPAAAAVVATLILAARPSPAALARTDRRRVCRGTALIGSTRGRSRRAMGEQCRELGGRR